MSNLTKMSDGRYCIKSCPICGKEKILPYIVDVTKYIYKKHLLKSNIYYCGYTCWKKATTKQPARHSKRRTEKQLHTRNVLYKMYWQEWQSGMTIKEIAKKHKCGTATVYRYLKAYREVMA